MDRFVAGTTSTGKPVQHGKASTYNNWQCRCLDCTEAWRAYIAKNGYVKRYQAKRRKKKGTKINL